MWLPLYANNTIVEQPVRLTDLASRYADAAVSFIEESNQQPFFLYMAFSHVHQLCAPRDFPEQATCQWAQGDESRKTFDNAVEEMDWIAGQILDTLDRTGASNNTLVLFTSDNGPTYTGGVDTPFFDSARPFQTTRGWGKGYVHEGGIRVPMVAHWPANIAAGSRSDHISAFYDFMPTFADAANIPMTVPTDGISMLPALTGQDQPAHRFLYWEFPAYNGQQAVRMGKWKGIRKDLFDGNLEVALYNLEEDPGELNDVAAAHPAVVQEIEAIMAQEHVPATLERFLIPQLGD